jgi:hypothetical protein
VSNHPLPDRAQGEKQVAAKACQVFDFNISPSHTWLAAVNFSGVTGSGDLEVTVVLGTENQVADCWSLSEYERKT